MGYLSNLIGAQTVINLPPSEFLNQIQPDSTGIPRWVWFLLLILVIVVAVIWVLREEEETKQVAEPAGSEPEASAGSTAAIVTGPEVAVAAAPSPPAIAAAEAVAPPETATEPPLGDEAAPETASPESPPAKPDKQEKSSK